MASSYPSVCIVGSGPAGLITAHTLLQDGFTNVSVFTRDKTPGGVWAMEKLYPGMRINKCAHPFLCLQIVVDVM